MGITSDHSLGIGDANRRLQEIAQSLCTKGLNKKHDPNIRQSEAMTWHAMGPDEKGSHCVLDPFVSFLVAPLTSVRKWKGRQRATRNNKKHQKKLRN